MRWIPIPLEVLEKNTLADFDICSDDGKRLPILTRVQNSKLIAAVLSRIAEAYIVDRGENELLLTIKDKIYDIVSSDPEIAQVLKNKILAAGDEKWQTQMAILRNSKLFNSLLNAFSDNFLFICLFAR